MFHQHTTDTKALLNAFIYLSLFLFKVKMRIVQWVQIKCRGHTSGCSQHKGLEVEETSCITTHFQIQRANYHGSDQSAAMMGQNSAFPTLHPVPLQPLLLVPPLFGRAVPQYSTWVNHSQSWLVCQRMCKPPIQVTYGPPALSQWLN